MLGTEYTSNTRSKEVKHLAKTEVQQFQLASYCMPDSFNCRISQAVIASMVVRFCDYFYQIKVRIQSQISLKLGCHELLIMINN